MGTQDDLASRSALVVEALARALPARALATDPSVLEGYRHDQAPSVAAGMPAAVVHAASTADVQAVVRLAAEHRVPLVARGAGSGLSGGANAIDGCIVLSLAGMTRIREIDPANMFAVVEPGVLNGDLSKSVADVGLWYPPDPASADFSTLGGNVATNAGGLCCVKYGVTRDFVLGLEVVLADGTALRTGRKTLKGVAGYDLTALFVGSEGTLGIVTEATLRLRPAPNVPATLVAFFGDLAAAGRAIVAIATTLVPSLLELMDHATLEAIEEWHPMDLDLDAAALVIARSDAGGDQGVAEIERMADVCRSAGATFVGHSSDPAESEMLVTARRLASPALERRGARLLDDVAVPIGRIPDLLHAIEETAARHGVLIGTFGHAGDGNMHPRIAFDPSDGDSTARARAAFDDIVHAALRLGGTITGEHGVGLLKRPYLEAEIGTDAMRVHAALKSTLDPLGILNPGKML